MYLLIVGVAESAEAMEEITEFIISVLNMEHHHIVVCCIEDDDGQINEIIGSSIMALTRKDDPKPEVDNKNLKGVYKNYIF